VQTQEKLPNLPLLLKPLDVNPALDGKTSLGELMLTQLLFVLPLTFMLKLD
jgi:hypothetical protein